MKTREQRIGEKKAYDRSEKYLSKRQYKCLYNGCSKIAVKSHSQQKNGPLKAISKDGKVYRLDDNLQRCLNVLTDKIEYRFSLKGVRESSVFPGFCIEHESIFSIFEDCELIVGNKAQACALFYRTVAYEKARKRREHDRWKFLQNELVPVFGYPNMWRLTPQIEEFNRHIVGTCDYHMTKAHEMMLSESYSGLSVEWVKVQHNIKVSCSTTINLHLDDYIDYAVKNPSKPLPTFTLNLIPSKQCTHIVVSWLSEFEEYAGWLREAFSDLIRLERYVNRFCFCDSEDACIGPELWEEVEDMEAFIDRMRHVIQRGKLSSDSIPSLIRLVL